MKLHFSFKNNFDIKLNLQKRVIIIGCYFLFILPCVALLIFFNHRMHYLDELEGTVDRLVIRIERIKQTQKGCKTIMSRYEDVDHFYIDHALESMVLLKPEMEALTLIYRHPAFKTCKNVKNRFEKLTQGDNKIILVEENREVTNGIEEVELSQSHPVEINTNDLKRIVSAVEGVAIGNELPPKGRPQFIVKGFSLHKNKLTERETFLFEMQLVKRGYVK